MKAGATSAHDVREMFGDCAAAAWSSRFAPMSLDMEMDSGDGTKRLIDVVADEDAIDPEAAAESTRVKTLVREAMKALTPMERHVIEARTSATDGSPKRPSSRSDNGTDSAVSGSGSTSRERCVDSRLPS